MSDELRFRIYRSDDGWFELIDEETGRRVVSTQQEEFLVYEILCLLHKRRPAPTFMVPKFVSEICLGFSGPK